MTSLIRLFPLLAIIVSAIAIIFPQLFVGMRAAIVPLLGIVMFGMGITLLPDDFLKVFRQPSLVLFGLAMQFTLMPLIAWLLGTCLNLPLAILTGLVLVGACPGGTASNVICYLAKGDVALSITLTAFSTLCAVFLTPFLTWVYLGQSIDVPVVPMIKDIFFIVVFPVLLGVLSNVYVGRILVGIKHVFPIVSMLVIVLIIGIIMALNQAQLSHLLWPVVLAVVLHNTLGIACGYGLPALLGYDKRTCRTLAIEVGMQNSGLGVALASKFFTVATALPGAIFSIWHNISGALLAAFWTGRDDNKI